MNRRPWWETELLQKQPKEKSENTKKWLENEFTIKTYKDKEEIITQAFNVIISKKRKEIKKLYENINTLQKECIQCLAKIYNGDTGIQEILKESNTTKSTQTQTETEQN